MNLGTRRRQENSRKRGSLDSSRTSSNNLDKSDNSPPSKNGKSSVSPPEPSRYAKLATNKAYAVHDPGLEDLDRLVMFITESKQIQGRYYVRYLPGMMNSAGELTPCNYRPTFSFSPPPSSPVSSPNTTPNNTSLKKQKNSVVVDLTDEKEQQQDPQAQTKDPKVRTGSISGRGGSQNEIIDDGDKKTGVSPSSSKTPLLPGASGYSSPRKQTARKSMKTSPETRPKNITDVYSDDDDDDDDDGGGGDGDNQPQGGEEDNYDPSLGGQSVLGLDFYEIFNVEQKTLDFCKENELISRFRNCSLCSSSMRWATYPNVDKFIWRCPNRACRKKISIRDGSFFSRSKLSISKILLFIYLWSEKYASNLIVEEFNYSKQTVCDWNRFLRELCCDYYNSNTETRIGGPNKVVELDKSVLVRNRHDQAEEPPEQQWLFGGVCRDLRDDSFSMEVFIEFVSDRSPKTLEQIIQRRIHKDSTIMTIGREGYTDLTALGYKHKVAIEEQQNPDPSSQDFHTRNVENLWVTLKNFLKDKGPNRDPQDSEYVAEFIFRKHHPDVFSAILECIRNKYRTN